MDHRSALKAGLADACQDGPSTQSFDRTTRDPASLVQPLVPSARLEQAVTQLLRHDPSMSASTGLWRRQRHWLLAIGLTASIIAITAPSAASITIQFVFAVAFAMLLCVRLLALRHMLIPATKTPGLVGHDPTIRAAPEPGTLFATPIEPTLFATPIEPLPVYTVLIALHAEVPVVPQLVAAMRALTYPAAKLDIIFALEAHDTPTRAALLAEDLPPQMRLVVVPAGLPRTKPRALCYALTFARGDYIVVYDAEDLPEPDQLQRALTAFRNGPPSLGCLQASLAINNAGSSWLTAQFAVEYTALFDAILPAFAANNLPIPLGGTSNHFTRQALDQSGGWDPYNVTEDADLGLRLARNGFQVGVICSTTWEEAPATWQPWLAQRTRWQKGWLQTYFVHMRDPVQLWRDLGPVSWIWFQIVLGGGLLSTLAHPWFYAMLALDWTSDRLFPPLSTGPSAWLWWIGVINLALAWLATIALAVITVRRRRSVGLLRFALMAPLYWLPVSYAGYRAIFEWIRAPFYWAKTPHGATPPAVNRKAKAT